MNRIQLVSMTSKNTVSDINVSLQKQIKGGNVIVPADSSNNFILQQNGRASVSIDEKSIPGQVIINANGIELTFAK